MRDSLKKTRDAGFPAFFVPPFRPRGADQAERRNATEGQEGGTEKMRFAFIRGEISHASTPSHLPSRIGFTLRAAGYFPKFPGLFYGLLPRVTRMMPTMMRPPKKSMRMMSPVSESTTWMLAAVSFRESKIVCAAMVRVRYVRGELRMLGGELYLI